MNGEIEKVELKDKDGNVVVEFSPKSYVEFADDLANRFSEAKITIAFSCLGKTYEVKGTPILIK